MQVSQWLVVFVLAVVCASNWTAVAGLRAVAVKPCSCPNPSYYGPLPRFEKVTSALCAMVVFAPRSDLSEPIKAGCALLAHTQLRESVDRISEFASTLQQLFNETLRPNWRQGQALRARWVAAGPSDPARRAALEQQWSGLFNVTIGASTASADVMARYVAVMVPLQGNLTTATVTDFMTAHTGCGTVNMTNARLESDRAYWEGVLRNCSVPVECTDAKEMIANVTKQIDELAPLVEFCDAYSPWLAQAYDQFRRLDLALQQLANAQEFLLNDLRTAVEATRRCSALSSDLFSLFSEQAILALDQADQMADVVGADVCAIETVPC